MKAFITSRVDDFINDLKTIVNIDSSSDNMAGIEAVAHFFRKRLAYRRLYSQISHTAIKRIPGIRRQDSIKMRP